MASKLVQGIGSVALAALAWLACEAAWTVHQARPKILLTISNVDRATISAGAAAGNLERASRAWEQASKEQSSNTSMAMSSVNAAAKGVSLFISRTDESLNSGVLPALTATISEQNAALLENQRSLSENLSGISTATTQLQKTLADADERISDPAIQESMDNLAAATRSAAAATEHLSNITAEGEKTAVYYERKLTTPAGFFKSLGNWILDTAYKARAFFP